MTTDHQLRTLHRHWRSTGDPKAFDALCKSQIDRADALCRKLRSDLKGADFEEAEAEGRDAIRRAVEKFDPDRGTALATYTYAAVFRALTTFRRGGPIHVPRGAGDQAKRDAACRTVGLDVVADNPAFARSTSLDVLERDEIAATLESLKSRDRDVLYSLFFAGRTIAETAVVLGISGPKVVTARNRAVEVLRRKLRDFAPEKTSEI